MILQYLQKSKSKWSVFHLDKYVNLAGWGLKLDEETKKLRTTSYMKVISLVVNSRDTCEDIFSVDDLRNNGIDLTADDIRSLKLKLKYGFTSEVTCMGNDFDISEG